MGRAVRVGVLGLRRGAALARLAQAAGMQVVAVCERDVRRREEAAKALGAAAYADVEPFLDHAMDAVILVNDFDQHAPVAIRALDRGLSVLSETAACRTLAEGVALVEAAERSSGIYMFAENYPYMPFTREMRHRYQAGDIGEVRYAEAEYLDEPADLAWFVNDRAHWRARTPATYYCTHSLAPVATITGTRPVQVSGFVVPTASGPEALDRARRGRGWAALLIVRLDNGAMFKALHGFLEAGQQSWVRIHGDNGLMENLRHGDTRNLRVVWDAVDGKDGRAEEVFLPWPPEFPATTADPMGDGVAETLMLRDFASAVRHEVAPDQDVYLGVELSIIGIQAMRSSLDGSVPVEVPDLRRPDVRPIHAADDWFPDLPEL
ncbi:MAG TPA: Gfo/Idh/MocA family oxidoreductase [Actinomycetes bacterium]|nr:Gfo/Idh/MocA family oxidoreductase [Actinomycetes bacterium]